MTRSDDDEFFGNQDNEDHHNNNDSSSITTSQEQQRQQQIDGLTEREIRSTEEQFYNMGYLQAFEESKEERLQEGFEAGYRHYFEAARHMGQLLGELTTPLSPQEPNAKDDSSLSEDRASKKENAQQRRQVIKDVRSFLVNIDRQDNDNDDMESSKVATDDALEALTQQLQNVISIQLD